MEGTNMNDNLSPSRVFNHFVNLELGMIKIRLQV